MGTVTTKNWRLWPRDWLTDITLAGDSCLKVTRMADVRQILKAVGQVDAADLDGKRKAQAFGPPKCAASSGKREWGPGYGKRSHGGITDSGRCIMYSIDRKPWGIMLVFGGTIDANEMARWVEESEAMLSSQHEKFGVLVDMRTLAPLMADAEEQMQKGQKLFKMKGMERSAVILNNPLLTMQFRRIARETGIVAWERYIDASKHPDWERMGVAWLSAATEPKE